MHLRKAPWACDVHHVARTGLSAFCPVTAAMFDSKISAQCHDANPGLEFRRILVPTDFSTGARRALECARSIARKFQSEIHLLHVIPSDVFEMASPETSRRGIGQWPGTVRRSSNCDGLANGRCPQRNRASQQPRRRRAALAGDFRERLKRNRSIWSPSARMARAASKKLVLGSVAEEVYRMAHCPILTVPPQIEIVPGR